MYVMLSSIRVVKKCFPKVEKLLKAVYNGIITVIKRFNPRFIQGNRPEYNIRIGPYCYTVMHWLFHGQHLPCEWVPACGLTCDQLGETIHHFYNDGYKFAWSIDRSSWDASMTTHALEASFDLLHYIVPMSRSTRQAFNKQLSTFGVTYDGIKFTNVGRVHSGDANTSLGNTLLSFMSASYSLDSLGIVDFKLIAIGDDLLVLLRNPCKGKFEHYVQHQQQCFNITTTGHVAYHPVDFDFISSHPLPTYSNGQLIWTMVPTVGKCFPKLFYKLDEACPEPLPWIRGVVKCMRFTANAHPFFNAILDSIHSIVGTGPIYINMKDREYKMSNDCIHQPIGLASEWLVERYHENVFALYSLLDRIHKVHQIPYLFRCDLSKVTERDTK